jgi:hypothetical protein
MGLARGPRAAMGGSRLHPLAAGRARDPAVTSSVRAPLTTGPPPMGMPPPMMPRPGMPPGVSALTRTAV